MAPEFLRLTLCSILLLFGVCKVQFPPLMELREKMTDFRERERETGIVFCLEFAMERMNGILPVLY